LRLTFGCLCAFVLSIVAIWARPLHAQQYITDDAGITGHRACQIQMWHGERSSWVLPVCSPLRNIELSLGFIAVWKDEADGHFEYTAQGKTLFKPLTTNSWGAGLVLGTGRDPAFVGLTNEGYTIYGYVPLSVSFGDDRVILHENTGWLYGRTNGVSTNAVTWALRGDVRVTTQFTVTGEVYGAEDVGSNGGGTPAEFQMGVRRLLRREHVQLDLSYGGTLRTGSPGAGWTIGLALITPPFL